MATPDRLQFIHGDIDITTEFHREDDATEVRVWDIADLMLLAVGCRSDGRWEFRASDYGAEPDKDMTRTFARWQDALDDFGYADLISR